MSAFQWGFAIGFCGGAKVTAFLCATMRPSPLPDQRDGA